MKRPRPKRLVEILCPDAFPSEPDPLDIGALLDAACDASGLTNATIAAQAAVDPGNLSRARRNPNARPELARRVLAAIGARVALVPPPRPEKG